MRHRHFADVLEYQQVGTSGLNTPLVQWVVVRRRVPVTKQLEERRETQTGIGQATTSTHLIIAGVNPPFNAANRLRIDGEVYSIDSLDPDVLGRHHHSEATATVVTERT